MTSDELEAMILHYRGLMAQIAEIQDEATQIKARIDAEVEIGWSVTIDGQVASKRAPNRSFDSALALAFLEDHEKEACKVLRYDEKLVRALVKLKGHEDECMAPGTGAPVVRLG